MAQILIVEDEESLLQTLRYNLSRAGHDVRLSTNGAQALEMIRGNPPELVVARPDAARPRWARPVPRSAGRHR